MLSAIVTFQNLDGTFDNVGMTNRWPMTGLKTERGYLNRANAYRRVYRIEFFRGNHGLSGHYRTEVVYPKSGR